MITKGRDTVYHVELANKLNIFDRRYARVKTLSPTGWYVREVIPSLDAPAESWKERGPVTLISTPHDSIEAVVTTALQINNVNAWEVI